MMTAAVRLKWKSSLEIFQNVKILLSDDDEDVEDDNDSDDDDDDDGDDHGDDGDSGGGGGGDRFPKIQFPFFEALK